MRKIIFGGTTEGREIACQCAAQGDDILVCVFSEAGRRQLPEGMNCHVGPLNADEMAEKARAFGAEEIIDATHPFAEAVTRNIRACAEKTGIPMRRIHRSSDREADFSDAVTWVDSAQEAAELLGKESGNIFLATGSNTVGVYAAALGTDRLYVRVLPNQRSIEKCDQAGMPASHVIAMQGPFSEELNGALYRLWRIRHLVSKDSGDVGGVREKVLPALAMGIHVVMIRRPLQGD